ncbi:protein tyrosine phosphatase [Sphaerisporangium sp. TRM90804]|uniref:phosphatase domain-containing protein n=1 Tax=Sphaerisporangium sp. TRM90804 TaxID=3031113 RepID=UPI00244AC070|nr:protein tyrosine phosphatase [Sphaerisporangium sp. TRM90804]MDH2429247.1 protein tyrosine phosphatase [Sphaerisporangium sp. TRM90804]
MRSLELPDGGAVLARGLRGGVVPEPAPEFGVYLLGHALDRPNLYGRYLVGLRAWTPSWPYERIDWPDFSGPRRPGEAVGQLRGVLSRIRRGERVEVACGGGRGRTGTALAALAVLQGRSPEEAVSWVREAYDAKAVESRAQHRFLRLVAGSSG